MISAEQGGSPRQRTSGILIVNPRAGGGRFLDGARPSAVLRRLQGQLTQAGFDLVIQITASAEEATQVAAEADGQGHQVAFALGGDGTFRDVARGLLGSATARGLGPPTARGPRPPIALGLLGGGTTNVLPYSLGLPRRAEQMGQALAGGGGWHATPLDVGRLVTASGEEHLFLMMVSRGLDSRALARTSPERKRRFGRLGIAFTAFAEWVHSADPSFELGVDDKIFHTTFSAIHNIEHYGGTFRMAPGARPDDRQLSVVGLRRQGRGAMAGFALGVLASSHLRNPRVFQLAASEATFGGDGTAEIQMDGDAMEIQLPASIDLYEDTLFLVRPGMTESTSC